jgi:uncharacterized MAPEG superfamily protein
VPVELQVLAWAVVLAAVQLASFAIPANLELGAAYTLGPRDEPRTLSRIPARLQRAFGNHLEGLVLYAAAASAVAAGDASSPFTGACAVVYLLARIAYVPAYASGVLVLRSAIWSVGFLATLAMALAALI